MQIKQLTLGACHTNSYLLEAGGKCLIVDPADRPEAFIEVIEENGWQPQASLLTHAHTDRVLPGHGPENTPDKERHTNPYLT